MSKKWLFALALLLATVAQAQNPALSVTYAITTAGAQSPVAESNYGVGWHQITWRINGTVTGCSVRVDTDANNAPLTFNAGDGVTAQTCTSNGQANGAAAVYGNNVRVNMTSLTCTGSCTVYVNYSAFYGNPAAFAGAITGSGTSGTLTKWTSATALGNSQVTDNGIDTVTVGNILNTGGAVGVGSNLTIGGTAGQTSRPGITYNSGNTTAGITGTMFGLVNNGNAWLAQLDLAGDFGVSGIVTGVGNKAVLTADWTCGTGGTVSSCTAATIIGSGGGVPLTFTLPLNTASWRWECNLVVGQATAATANQWNILTATNGATNVTANYMMNTAATAMAGGAVTDQTSTTTTFQIAPSWTLGGTATKMPVRIWGSVEGASASGTVLSLQLLEPTVADLVTIYRGSECHIQ